VRWLVLGANGMLGQDLTKELENQNLKAFDKSQCDITNYDQVRSVIKDVDIVINCAAYTAVDDAETNRDLAFKINGQGSKNLAIRCNEIGAKLVHFSTDYVFSGDANHAYQENDEPSPKSVYGKSKLAGELEVRQNIPHGHYIIRTAWLYGKNGKHFGKTILNLAKSNERLKVVDDQIGQPTWTKDLAKKTVEVVVKSAPTGIYHGTSEGQVSWFEYAQNIFELAGLDKNRLEPVKSDRFPRPAPRPHFSVLGHESFEASRIEPIRQWREALLESFEAEVFND